MCSKISVNNITFSLLSYVFLLIHSLTRVDLKSQHFFTGELFGSILLSYFTGVVLSCVTVGVW